MASKQTGHFLSVTVGIGGGTGGSDGIITMGPCDFKVFLRLAVGSVTVFTTVTSSKAVKFLEFRKFRFFGGGGGGEEVMGRGRVSDGTGSGDVNPLSAKVLIIATSEFEFIE